METCQKVEANAQKIFSSSTPAPLTCILSNSDSLKYLNRGNNIAMEENSSSVWKKIRNLIGVSSVEGLDSLRTLRRVQRESSIPTETSLWPDCQCLWNIIFPKKPRILFLKCVPKLVLLSINIANIQALPHHQKLWTEAGEIRADCLFYIS